MQRATAIVRKPAVKADNIVESVLLAHAERQGQNASLTGEKGTGFSVALEKMAALNDGDALKLEDGSLILVKAKPQALIEVRAENPARLLQAAFHFGSNHVACEVTPDALYVEANPATAEMARSLGCIMSDVSRAFEPERAVHHHHHDHDHDHQHHHHDHDHHHAHGASCGCGHHHDHDHAHHDHDHHGHDHHGHKHD